MKLIRLWMVLLITCSPLFALPGCGGSDDDDTMDDDDDSSPGDDDDSSPGDDDDSAHGDDDDSSGGPQTVYDDCDCNVGAAGAFPGAGPAWMLLLLGLATLRRRRVL